MSIQRWTFINGAEPHWLEEHPMGEYVTYADHVAAVAAAQREGANQGYLNGVATNADNSFKAGVKAARDAVTAVQAERGYDAAINWSEIGNEYAEGWTDLLSLILPAIDAIIDGSRNTG